MLNIKQSYRAESSVGPASSMRPVTPNDDVDLPDGLARSIYVGGGGDIVVVDSTGVEAKIVSGASQYHPVRVIRVRASGTTATDILALY